MVVTTKLLKILLIATLCVVFSSGVLAYNTHINITLSETVNQNVTYAQNFVLEENRTYSLIEGVVLVENTYTETLYDINIQLDNVSFLSSNFTQVAGRNGYQVIYPDTTANQTNLTGSNVDNSSWKSLGRDIDEDGVIDSVQVNNTHIIFNVTSEWELRAYTWSNSSNSSIDIGSPAVLNMNFNITSLRVDREYNDNVTFATITILGNTTTASELNVTNQTTFTVDDSARTYAILHIPELRQSDSTTYNYNISSALVSPPLDIDTTYTNPEFQTKVLAGERFLVQLQASNVATVGALESVNITMNAQDTNVTNGSTSQQFNFTLHNLSNSSSVSADYANVDGNGTNNRTWNWIVNNGTIAVGASYNITFQIQAPYTVQTSGTYLALLQELSYTINTTGSTLAVGDVRARAAIVFNTTKRIVNPQDNLSNNNVTWQSIPQIGTSENITFTIEKVTLWVTQVLDPNEVAYSLTTDYYPSSDINISTTWTGGQWLFNFTDGSSDAAPPPIVWVKPYWIIRNVGNQIINSSITVNGTDLYMNYIYVVNGYWLEVQKQVLDAGNDQFDIRTTVRNRGNGYTPQNLTVTVYDFIPTEFAAWNFTPSADNSSNVTGQFTGVAYQWDVGLRTNLSTSFAPAGDALGLDYFYINYSVNGSGDFAVSDLYIVGLDPRLVENAYSYEGVSVLAALISDNRKEVFFVFVVIFLIAINVANFLMTSRISRKLGK